MVVAVSTERYRAICHPLNHRQSHYKYLIVVILISVGVRVPRFFEFQLVYHTLNNNTILDYDTTNLSEDPMYVQFNAYWNELLVTGLLPLILLVLMNFRIYLKIRASANFTQNFGNFNSSNKWSDRKQSVVKVTPEYTSQPPNSWSGGHFLIDNNIQPATSLPSIRANLNENASLDLEMAGILY